jgi:hypothetical protein
MPKVGLKGLGLGWVRSRSMPKVGLKGLGLGWVRLSLT